jgi:hypothetical protein
VRLRQFASAILIVLLSARTSDVVAQERNHRWEIALTVSSARFQDFNLLREQLRQIRPSTLGTAPLPTFRETGSGLRFGVRAWPHVGFEAEATAYSSFWNYWGRPDAGIFVPGGGKLTVVGGPVLRVPIRRWVLLGAVRPGIAHFSSFDAILDEVFRPDGLPGGLLSQVEPATFFAIDARAGVETPPWRRLSLRVDAGSMWVRYRPAPRPLNPVFSRRIQSIASGVSFHF